MAQEAMDARDADVRQQFNISTQRLRGDESFASNR
jgi:hypothetical protein